MEDNKIVEYVLACREEADSARTDRMQFTRDNYDQYHLKHDFSHKQPGQSCEVLSKVKMATETSKSFFQQALIKTGDWWDCESADGSDGVALPIQPYEIYKITNYKMTQAELYSHIGACVQAALLGSLAITKVHGCMKPKPKFVSRKKGRGKSFKRWLEKTEDKTWHLKYDLIDHKNYYPDPTSYDLYRIEECFLDLHVVKALSQEPYEIYDKTIVNDLSPWGNVDTEENELSDKTGQNPRASTSRPQVKITEFWGTVVDRDTGDILYENVVITLANDKEIIRKPTPNPLWHQRTPIIAAGLLEVGNSVWHTALMDAGTKSNRAQTEVYNLMIDAAMQAIHNIKQLHVDHLQDPKQVSGGIKPGVTLKVKSSLVPGAKVMEPVTTGNIPPEVVTLFNLVGQEGNAAMLTNDLRMGVQPFRQVKATEVVAGENSINSVFEGISLNVEQKLILPLLELSWQTVAQNWDLIDKEEFVALFGRERGEQLSQLAPEDVFAGTVSGIKFRVFGLSVMLNKSADFRKYTTLLQTIGASPMLVEEFLKAGNSFSKLLEEIMRSLDIDIYKLKESPSAEPAPAPMQPEPEAAPAPQSPNQMSQVPGAGSGSLADIFAPGSGGNMQQQNYPGSRALSNKGGGY